jgi:hypothetical protein
MRNLLEYVSDRHLYMMSHLRVEKLKYPVVCTRSLLKLQKEFFVNDYNSLTVKYYRKV